MVGIFHRSRQPFIAKKNSGTKASRRREEERRKSGKLGVGWWGAGARDVTRVSVLWMLRKSVCVFASVRSSGGGPRASDERKAAQRTLRRAAGGSKGLGGAARTTPTPAWLRREMRAAVCCRAAARVDRASSDDTRASTAPCPPPPGRTPSSHRCPPTAPEIGKRTDFLSILIKEEGKSQNVFFFCTVG